MKKTLRSLLVLVLAAAFLGGCTMAMSPIANTIYADYDGPLLVTGNSGWSKVGIAEATGIIGFGSGDVSIKAAMEDGGITKIHHVDYKSTNVLGVYSKLKVMVYGE